MWLALNVNHVEAEFLMHSRGLACAALQVKKKKKKKKKKHIRYLFIDVISINQTLQGIYLIQQVMAFSVLYKIIPVIVAYDELEEDFELTIMRLWIFVKCAVSRTIVPGLSTSAGTIRVQNLLLAPLQVRGRYANRVPELRVRPVLFPRKNDFLCNYSYRRPCRHDVLNCRLPISNARVCADVDVDIQTNGRNDYLLTAVILSKPSPDTPVHDSENIASLAYERYTFRSKPSAGDNTFNYTIIFGGAAVANWRICRDKGTGKSHFHLIVFPRAQSAIFTVLGQEREPYVKYFRGENIQGLDSQMDYDMRREQMPRLVVNSVCLHSYNQKKMRNVSVRGEIQQNRGEKVKALARSLCGL